MGSAASAFASVAAKSSSDELAKAFEADVPPDVRAKLLEALQKANKNTSATAPAAVEPTQPVYITWKEWETTVQIGSERLDGGFGSFDDGPRMFGTFPDEQPGTQQFTVGDVSFYAYAEEKPGTVKHTICDAGGYKWWVGPVGVDKGGREESGDGWTLTGTFWAPQSVTPVAVPKTDVYIDVYITRKMFETALQIGSERLDDGFVSFDDGPRSFKAFADEQPGTQHFSVDDVVFYAYAEERPGTVKHTISYAAGWKWWVGPVGVDKGGREESGDGWTVTRTFWAPQSVTPVTVPKTDVYITWKEWETTLQIGSERLDGGFGSFDDGPRSFKAFADEQPGTQQFTVGDVSFYAYAEEKPGTVKHTICDAGGYKWWVGPVGVDKGGREESGDGWTLIGTFWAQIG